MELEKFRIAWFCALPHELAASRCMLDEEYPSISVQGLQDENIYFPGRIGKHFVVLTCLPSGEYGTVSAATCARDILRTFTSLRFGLMVGIGGAVPEPYGIRLGDIVVSKPTGSHGGVIQYDTGKKTDTPEGEVVFERRGHLNKPPRILLSAIQGLQSSHEFKRSKIPQYISDMLNKCPEMEPQYKYPGDTEDPLNRNRFDATGARDYTPRIFYGLIASGNWVIASVKERERLLENENILCFEMEAAGLMNALDCLIIRGMSDYADPTKSDGWQRYAAATAAAYTKELLELVPSVDSPLSTTRSSISQELLQKCLSWLKYPNSKSYFESAYSKRTPNTGQWFLNHQFNEWKHSNYSFLWLQGKAGCGKTVLCSTIVKQIQNIESHTAYFYFSYRRTEARQLQQLLYALVTQLVRAFATENKVTHGHACLPKGFQKLYDQYLLETEPTIEDMKVALLEVLDELQPCFILIDALDECEPADSREDVLQFLQWLHERAPDGTHILITSRSGSDIDATVEDLEKFPNFRRISIQNSEVDDDISIYARHYLTNLSPYRGWTTEVKDTVTKELRRRCQGVFRWAECQMKELRTIETEEEILTALAQLPKDLDETYARMLQRTKDSKYAAKAFAALQWLAFAKKPLTVKQLAEIAAFEIQAESTDLYHATSFAPAKRFLQPMRFFHILSGLVVVGNADVREIRHDDISKDMLDSEITFAHYSVLEYLSCSRVDAGWRLSENVGHRFLFESCILYIQNWIASSQRYQQDTASSQYPLLAYASRYWMEHSKVTFQAGSQTQYTRRVFQEIFLKNNGCFIQVLRLLTGQSGLGRRLHYNDTIHCSPLYFLATQDMSFGIETVPEGPSGINDLYAGKSALHVACSRGHFDTAIALLNRGADVNQKSKWGWTALHYAARAGSVEIIKEILTRFSAAQSHRALASYATSSRVDHNVSPTYSEPPSSSVEGRIQVDVNTRTDDLETILHSAVRSGIAAVIELLTNSLSDMDLEAKNVYGLTPLHLAVRVASWAPGPSLQVIRTLVDAGAELQTTTHSGRTISEDVVDTCNTQLIQMLSSNFGMNYPETQSFVIAESNIPNPKLDYWTNRLPRYWINMYPAIQKALWTDEGMRSIGILLRSNAYSACHNYCTQHALAKPVPSGHSDNFTTFSKGHLYEVVSSFMYLHLQEIACSGQALEDHRVEFYQRASRRWLQFLAFASLGIFQYLERHFTNRIFLNNVKSYPHLSALGTRLWKLVIGERCLPSQFRRYRDGAVKLRSSLGSSLETYFNTMPEEGGSSTPALVEVFITGLLFDYSLDVRGMAAETQKSGWVDPKDDMREKEEWIIKKICDIYNKRDNMRLERLDRIGELLLEIHDGNPQGMPDFEILLKTLRNFDWDVEMGEYKWSILKETLVRKGFRTPLGSDPS